MSDNFMKGLLAVSLVTSSLVLVGLGLWWIHSTLYTEIEELIKESVEGSDKDKTNEKTEDSDDEKNDDSAEHKKEDSADGNPADDK